MTRYVIEAVAKQPGMKKIKDNVRNRYLKQPTGTELWPAPLAHAKQMELNAMQTTKTKGQ